MTDSLYDSAMICVLICDYQYISTSLQLTQLGCKAAGRIITSWLQRRTRAGVRYLYTRLFSNLLGWVSTPM